MKEFLAGIKLDKKKIIIILAAAAVIAFLDVAVLMKRQLEGIKSSSVKVAKLSKELKTLARDLDLMRQSQAKPKVSVKAKKIISQSDIPYLIQDIYDLAGKNSVKIMQAKPSQDARGQASTTQTGNFSPVYIQLELSCTYHRLGKFINDLENAGQFIAVEEIKILPDAKDPLQQRVSLSLKAYVKK